MKVSLVCIAKDEDDYIEEWINYHLKLGFDNIFIYQNDWQCNVQSTKVTRFQFGGKKKQVESYNHFIQNYWGLQDWIAFFDVDEFLVLKKHNNVKNFLMDYEDYDGIGINWVFFGSNGMKKVKNNEYSVLSRFTMRSKKPDKHIKSIIKSNKESKMSVHYPNHNICNTHKKIFYGPFVEPNDEIAQLNHYFTKSLEEFKRKRKRGRADDGTIRKFSDFYTLDINEVEDTYALKFYKR